MLAGNLAFSPEFEKVKADLQAARDAVIPAAVGANIGCGMIAVETDIPAEKFPFLLTICKSPKMENCFTETIAVRNISIRT